ncbi:MAG: outer membrane lipoprotein-sorting protein [bacterium]
MKKIKSQESGARISEAVLILCLVFLVPGSKKIFSDENLTPREIMQRVVDQFRPDTEVQEIEMTLVDKDGRQWLRTGTFYNKKKTQKDDMRLFVFHSPPDLDKSGVLTIENISGEDDQWIYVPAYHTVRRIPPSSRGSQYMGTDFYYEDIITPRPEEYEYTITGKEKFQGTECTIINSIPVSDRLKKESGYGKIIAWVDEGKYVILKQELYNKNNELIKILVNSGLKKYKNSYYWNHREMLTIATGHKTIIENKKITIDEPLDDEIFTIRFLKRGK